MKKGIEKLAILNYICILLFDHHLAKVSFVFYLRR